MKRSKDAEPAELATLRARLEEAEQTLEAIRSGQVDALIVDGPDGERVFTMQGADHRYRLLVEGMSEGAVMLGPEGVILYANMSFARLVATPLERVLGARFESYLPQGARPVFLRLLADAQQGVAAAETTLARSDGRRVAVRVSVAADNELAEGGSCLVVTDLTAVMRDMQARIETESALSRAEERERQVRELVDNLPELAWNARPDGYIDFFNHRWYEYTGTNLAQMNGWGWTSVLEPGVLPAVMERWQQSIASGEPLEMEFPIRNAGGGFRWFLTRARPLRDEQGKIVRWFGVNTDVDDARRERQRAEALAEALSDAAEARTQALEEAQRVSRAKDEFLATMSHELRTPLNAMLGWASMLHSGKLDQAKLARGLEVIERNARAQARLVDDLLDVSRIISGKLRLVARKTQVATVIQAAVDVVRQAADAKGIQLLVELPPDIGDLLVDPDRLQQVVWNLLSNAVKFTPTRGTVTVTGERVESRIRLRVQDTGLGIPVEHLPFIFERLRQVDGTSTRTFGGLGLGLAIVRHLVEAHGGTVTAHSAGLGTGATFTVDLPILAVDTSPDNQGFDAESLSQLAQRVSLLEAVPLRGRRVLVVEDDADSLELLRVVLEGGGAQVVVARRAAEALEQAERLTFDVIVSDIGMPEMDGYAFMRRLRASSAAAGVPAIALTAYARLEDADSALKAGYQEHLTKPVNVTSLVAAVARLATRSG